MAVDEAAPTLYRVRRDVSTKTTTKTSTRQVPVPETVDEEPEEELEPEVDIEEPASKKRRTSSEGDVEATVESVDGPHADDEQDLLVREFSKGAGGKLGEAVEQEDDDEPEVTGWDDLDAEDAADPLMVSEYVNEIFQYLSECEVISVIF